MTFSQKFILTTGRPLLNLVFRWKTEGRENVPQTGSLILVANHVHVLDPILLVFGCPRWISFMAKEELFRSRFLGFWVRWAGAFPIRRGGQISEQQRILASAREVLQAGEVLGVFPEGRRNRDGKLRRSKPGPAVIASKTNTTILPVGISGTDKIRGISWLWKRPDIVINIGKPFRLPPANGRLSRSQMQSLSNQLMEEIAALLPQEYRGDYDKPEHRES
jgi:1-acyl-sn-glycerol-3-phosphate acyltransferase